MKHTAWTVKFVHGAVPPSLLYYCYHTALLTSILGPRAVPPLLYHNTGPLIVGLFPLFFIQLLFYCISCFNIRPLGRSLSTSLQYWPLGPFPLIVGPFPLSFIKLLSYCITCFNIGPRGRSPSILLLYFTTTLGPGAIPPNSGPVPPLFQTNAIILNYFLQYWAPGLFPSTLLLYTWLHGCSTFLVGLSPLCYVLLLLYCIFCLIWQSILGPRAPLLFHHHNVHPQLSRARLKKIAEYKTINQSFCIAPRINLSLRTKFLN